MPYNQAMRAGNVPLFAQRRPHLADPGQTNFTVNFPAIYSAGTKLASGSQGATVVCSTGQWLGQNLTFLRQWYRNGATIANQTNASYVLVSTDSGKTVSCKVVATNKYAEAYMEATLPVLA